MKNFVRGKTLRFFVLGCFLAFFTLTAVPKKAEACCSCASTVQTTAQTEWYSFPGGTVWRITLLFVSEFVAHRIWYIKIFWEDNLLPAMMMMAEQLTAVAVQQAQIIGIFLDAKQQLETQQLFEKIRAKAHKDYHPTWKYGMCEIGSSSKSLAASDRRADFNALVLSQRSQDRNLGAAFTSAAAGEAMDKTSRIKQFRETFCDPMDNNNGLLYMCDHDQDGDPNTGPTGATDPTRMNKDIDFAATIDTPWTLDADFTDTDLTDDEQAIMALASNLYGHHIFKRPPSASLAPKAGVGITEMQTLYMDARSILAKQSVAENSYNAIVGMKTEGLPGSREYLLGLLEHLGIPGPAWAATTGFTGLTEAEILLGADPSHPNKKINPSYYAQMEVLTKKLFQNPDFYTHLYDTPTNIERKEVALQAIGLMQKFDLFKSYLRSEASISVLLELAVMDLQDEIENDISQQKAGGEPPSTP